jgi:hypothetical protein
MDFPGFQDAAALAPWVVETLKAYALPAGQDMLKDLRDRAAKGVVDKVCATAGRVWGWLKGRFAGDAVRCGDLEDFEKAPAEQEQEMASLLRKHLERDEAFAKAFAAEVHPLLEELAELQAKLPRIEKKTYAPQVVKGKKNKVIQQQGDGNIAQIGDAP